jgi:hypothetical protein
MITLTEQLYTFLCNQIEPIISLFILATRKDLMINTERHTCIILG